MLEILKNYLLSFLLILKKLYIFYIILSIFFDFQSSLKKSKFGFFIYLHFFIGYDIINTINESGGFFMSEKKNLEIVSGDTSNLNISPVQSHLNGAKPKSAKEKPKSIVIPKEKKEEK